jgi:hypothetical protein
MMTRLLRVALPVLFVFWLTCGDNRLAAQEDSKTASVGGKWTGKWSETNGHSGEFSIELAEDAGTLTGTWGGQLKVENGLRVKDTVAWSMKDGKSLYVVYGEIQNGGKQLTLHWTLVEPDDQRLRRVTGIGILQKE